MQLWILGLPYPYLVQVRNCWKPVVGNCARLQNTTIGRAEVVFRNRYWLLQYEINFIMHNQVDYQ